MNLERPKDMKIIEPKDTKEWNAMQRSHPEGYEVRDSNGEHLFICWLNREENIGYCIGNKEQQITFYKIGGIR